MSLTRRTLIKGLFLSGGGLMLTAGGGRKVHLQEMNSLKQAKEWQPAYYRLEESGLFAERIEQAYRILEKCTLCPRRCEVNRLAGEVGFCRAPAQAVVYSHQPHLGEEVPLVGRHGSGTIFFSNCNLRCVFCQNWPIAHLGRGTVVSDEQLAAMMLDLQNRGCHNINLVTPTHVMPNILNAVRIAMRKGLNIPLCYNTGGYELVENIRLLEGIVDIYLPDLKFMDGNMAFLYAASAQDYPQKARHSIIEMHRQVQDLITTEQGIARRGLMVRHLVMPNRVAGTQEFVQWVAQHLSRSTYINIMAQYRVEHRAFEYPDIARGITTDEFMEAITWAEEAGLNNLDGRSAAQFNMYRRRRE